MADAKSLLESIVRSFGYIYSREKGVRVNTISQSPTMTTAGSGVKRMDKLFDFANRMSPLGNADAAECADYCILMFSDLTRKVTMQNLYHDGGFSSVGMSLRAMATYEKGLDEYKNEQGNNIRISCSPGEYILTGIFIRILRTLSHTIYTMQKHIRSLLFLLLFFTGGCDVMLRHSEEKAEEKITIARYDRLLYEYVSAHSVVAWQKMNTDYTRIIRLLIEDILQLGSVMEPSINQQLISYFNDSLLIQLFDDVEEKYRNLDFLEKQLAGSFRQLKKEIPSLTVPRIYAQVSALNESILVEDSLIGISLDKYMGHDYPLYRDYYYDYQCRTMTSDRIAPDCLSFYLQYEYPFGFMTRPSLLNVILYFGKVHYIVSRVLGYNSLEEELGYTPEEIKWCRKNKNLVWERMVARGICVRRIL